MPYPDFYHLVCVLGKLQNHLILKIAKQFGSLSTKQVVLLDIKFCSLILWLEGLSLYFVQKGDLCFWQNSAGQKIR